MANKQKKNRYKRWFFFLLIGNIFYINYHFVETPSIVNHYKRIFNKLFYPPKVPHGDFTFGIDVSEYQGIISWRQVSEINEKQKVGFVIIRATAGNNKRDRFFTSNWRGSRKNNILRGAYHYFRPNENSTQQANNFIKNVQLVTGDLPPILDVEKTSKIQSDENLVKGVKNWLKIIENHYGVKPIVYTGAHFYNDHLNNNLNGYLVWVANYNRVKNPLNSVPWMIWQFSSTIKVSFLHTRDMRFRIIRPLTHLVGMVFCKVLNSFRSSSIGIALS
jgi:lysozyme